MRANAVLCAAGVWSNLFLGNLGIDLPQLALRGTVVRTERVASVFDGAAGAKDIFIRRRKDGGYTIASGMAEHFIGPGSFRYLTQFLPSLKSASELCVRSGGDSTQAAVPRPKWSADAVTPFEKTRVLNPAPSERALRVIRSRVAGRLPALADAPFAESWAGMIDATPDIVPVMDEVQNPRGLFIATGFSGHGFGIGPGAGKVMADLIEGKSPPHNLRRFRFARFSDGSKMIPGPGI